MEKSSLKISLEDCQYKLKRIKEFGAVYLDCKIEPQNKEVVKFNDNYWHMEHLYNFLEGVHATLFEIRKKYYLTNR